VFIGEPAAEEGTDEGEEGTEGGVTTVTYGVTGENVAAGLVEGL